MDNEPSSYYNIYPLLHYPYNCLVLEYVMTSSSESFIIEENVIPLSLFLSLFHSLSKLFEYFLVFFLFKIPFTKRVISKWIKSGESLVPVKASPKNKYWNKEVWVPEICHLMFGLWSVWKHCVSLISRSPGGVYAPHTWT